MTLNNSKIRQYRPEPGALVKLALWEHYAERHISIWSWLRVVDYTPNGDLVVHVAPSPNDEAKDSDSLVVPLEIIDTPIGWKPRYTIYTKPEQAQIVVNDWFKRGIVVRANHEIGSSYGSAFQPLDNSDTPHWRYPNRTDVISTSDCSRLFRVIAVEEQEITSEVLGFPADPECPHCRGKGRRTLEELSRIRHCTIQDIRDNPINLDGLRDDDTFRCSCHYGALARMGRTKRGKLFAAMRKDGWTVKYVRYAGGFWTRTRETVVHDWAE